MLLSASPFSENSRLSSKRYGTILQPPKPYQLKLNSPRLALIKTYANYFLKNTNQILIWLVLCGKKLTPIDFFFPQHISFIHKYLKTNTHKTSNKISLQISEQQILTKSRNISSKRAIVLQTCLKMTEYCALPLYLPE